ncbi:hypothetical protein [Pantoea ananatis]|uniref:hypothetical protein n=1 Tax=Pantoea ananas TaxID=553 RepID=UPI003F97632D
MSERSQSAENFIRKNMFSITGETFFDYEYAEEDIYQQLNMIGIRLTSEIIPGNSNFYIVESQQVQAVAIHDIQTVMVYKGMLEYIFRIVSMMAGAECRKRDPATERFMPWEGNMCSWLQGGEFDWKNEKYWWLLDPDWRQFFDKIVDMLFTFVVLHEIGHLHNLHGWRRTVINKEHTSTASDSLVIHHAVEEDGNKILVDRLAGHVREIVADTFAFQFMVEEFQYVLFPELRLPDIDSASRSTCEVTNFVTCLYCVAAYFWAIHYRKPMTNDSQLNDYPSHAFRLVSIESASLEHGLGAGLHDRGEGLELGILNYLTKLPIASGNSDFIDWRLSVDTSANEEHYSKICEIVKDWSNGFFGIPDEEWMK